MKTEDWIDMLARQAGPAPRSAVLSRVAPVAVLGFVISAVMSTSQFAMVPPEYFSVPAWWLKFGYVAFLALAGALWLAYLGRPAAARRGAGWVLAVVLGSMLLLGLADWQLSAPDTRLARLMGYSWASCPSNVLLLSLPAMAGAFWALRGLAPMRPVWAGAAAGLFAGGLGAMGYSLICTEVAPSFVAVWYTLGVAAAALLGGALGARLLRW